DGTPYAARSIAELAGSKSASGKCGGVVRQPASVAVDAWAGAAAPSAIATAAAMPSAATPGNAGAPGAPAGAASPWPGEPCGFAGAPGSSGAAALVGSATWADAALASPPSAPRVSAAAADSIVSAAVAARAGLPGTGGWP